MPKRITKVGKYEIVDKLAKGGMGEVYVAKHPTLKRYVILKRLTLRGGRELSERFKREASLMIDFRDEHIVQVYDHFKEGSSYYIVMEYVDGISLDKLIQERGKLSQGAAMLIFYEICKGLKYAHDKGVIHRDIKPANILISREGEVKLVDFGIATSEKSEGEGLTQVGTTMGTPCYMSPEQIADSSSVDKRADIYSAGVVLYEMLTGEKPFPNTFDGKTITRISRGIYVNPKKLNPDIPRVCKRIIKKTMNYKLNRRYSDLQVVLDKLSKYVRKYGNQNKLKDEIKKYLSGSEISSVSVSRVSRRRKPFIRRVVISLIIAGLIITGGLYFFKQGYYYEYFKPDVYGSLEVRVKIPENYYKEIDKVYAHTLLKRGGRVDVLNKKVKEYSFYLTPSKSFIFSKIFEESGKKLNYSTFLTSKRLYIPAGNYEMVLYLENQKYYYSFYLNPRKIQKQEKSTKKARIVSISFEEMSKKPITIIQNIYDSRTGESVYDITDILFFLEESGKWIDWKRYNSNEFFKNYLQKYIKSGKNFSFIYKAPHYYKKEVRFYVENGMDSVNIDIYLDKIPGKLIIESNIEGIELMIDNQREAYTGGIEKRFVKYGKTIKGRKEFLLREGIYILTVKKGRKAEKTIEFKINSELTTGIRVNYLPDKKEIKVTKGI